MSVVRTTYEVVTEYKVKERNARRGLGELLQGANRASGAMGRLGTMIKGAMAAYVGGRALGAAKSFFIDYNSMIEQSTISIAFQRKLLDKGLGWKAAKREAAGYFDYYQDVAKKSVGETEDFLEMHKQISGQARLYGAVGDEIKDMVKGATITSQVLGERADMVALDVKQMLQGRVNARDRTAQMLLGGVGMSYEKFNKLNAKQRRETVLKALRHPAIGEAAKDLENSFAGVTSTFMDNLKIGLGKVGLPLMKRITAEVKKWNAWIEKNPEKIKRFSDQFASALVSGFEAVKGVAKFLAEHKDTLLQIAKAVLVLKGVGAVAGGLQSAAGALGGAGGVLGRLQTISVMATTAYLTGKMIEKEFEEKKASEEEGFGKQAGLDRLLASYEEAVEKGQMKNAMNLAKLIRRDAMGLGLVDANGNIRKGISGVEKAAGGEKYRRDTGFFGKLAAGALEYTGGAKVQTYAQMAKASDIAAKNTERLAAVMERYANTIDSVSYRIDEKGNRIRTSYTQAEKDRVTVEPIEDPGKRRKAPGGDTNITINKVEVASPDADRFVFDFRSALDKINRAPTQARSVLEGGF